MHSVIRAALLGTALGLCTPALAGFGLPQCSDHCSVELTPAQVLAQAEALVQQREFALARPFVEALVVAKGYDLQRHFLSGYIAVETGQTDAAIAHFRAALAINPKDTRVRLELARALLLTGKREAADYNYRLAQQDGNLPPEIAATIRTSRGLLRDSREWHLSTSFGFAPDSNITNATNAQTIDFNFGNLRVDLPLDANARQRSGIGQTGSISAGWRGRFGENWAVLIDVDGQGTNYAGTAADDFTGQFAIGPELTLDGRIQLSAQAIGSQRWFAGQRAATQFGGRAAGQIDIGRSQRAGLTVDVRHTASGFSPAYSGWSYGAYASYERVMARSLVASATVFGRIDALAAAPYSSKELGINLGVGGEFRRGINAGISGGVSRAVFDAPLLAFSAEARKDWRLNARVYAGLRSIRLLGFSPSITYTYSRNDATLPLYKSERSRFAFELARYF